MPLYTKVGDTGKTMTLGGSFVPKSSTRVHVVGSLDELSALLGVILIEDCGPLLRSQLLHIQHLLFTLGADLGMPRLSPRKTERLQEEAVTELERWIDAAEDAVPPLRHFILPGGSRVGALLHQARTVCRRAERWIVALSKEEEIHDACLRYVNRLGDFLFAAARRTNGEQRVEETPVSYRHSHGA